MKSFANISKLSAFPFEKHTFFALISQST